MPGKQLFSNSKCCYEEWFAFSARSLGILFGQNKTHVCKCGGVLLVLMSWYLDKRFSLSFLIENLSRRDFAAELKSFERKCELFEILVVWLGQSFKGRIACVGPLPSLILPPFCLTWVAPRQLEEQDVSFYHPTVSLNLLANSGLSLLFWLGLVVLHDTLCGIHSECDGTQNNTDIGVLHRWKAMDKGQNFRKDSCTLIGEQ